MGSIGCRAKHRKMTRYAVLAAVFLVVTLVFILLTASVAWASATYQETSFPSYAWSTGWSSEGPNTNFFSSYVKYTTTQGSWFMVFFNGQVVGHYGNLGPVGGYVDYTFDSLATQSFLTYRPSWMYKYLIANWGYDTPGHHNILLRARTSMYGTNISVDQMSTDGVFEAPPQPLAPNYAISSSIKRVHISWGFGDAASRHQTGFNVYRDQVKLNSHPLPADQFYFYDYDVAPGRTYKYAVAAVYGPNHEVESYHSTGYKETTVTTPSLPMISTITPNSGPSTGATLCTIQGSRMDMVTSVTFDTTSVPFSLSSGAIKAMSPAHNYGNVLVSLGTAWGTSTTPVTFTYNPSLANRTYAQSLSTIVYSGTWTTGSGTTAQYTDGDYKYTSATNAWVKINFTGTSVTWLAKKGPGLGTATVSLDGGPAQTVNLSTATALYKQTAYSKSGLTNKPHTLKITRATGTINIDGVKVIGVLTAWKAEYFNNMTLTGPATFTGNSTDITYHWCLGGPGGGLSNDGFSVRWTKHARFNAGTYTFKTYSDDGIRLYVDNVVKIDRWNDHALTYDSVTVTLTAGFHVIKLEYYEHGDRATAVLWW